MQTNAEGVERILDAVATVVRALRQQQPDGVEGGLSHLLIALLEGDLRPTALAQRAHLDASTVSRHVDALVAKGLVERKPDPADGRARLVALTSAGRSAVHRTKQRRRRAITDQLSRWPQADVDTLATLLTRLARDMSNNPTEGPRP